MASNNLLGQLDEALPAGLAREQSGVVTRFTYDINGVLQVEATVLHTGQTVEVVLKGDNAALSMDEIRERLASLAHLKRHPRDAQENLATLARAERVYEECLGEERQFVQAWLARFKATIERQDPLEIAEMRAAFEQVLGELEAARP